MPVSPPFIKPDCSSGRGLPETWPLAAGVCEDSGADGVVPGPSDQLWGEQHLPGLPAGGEIFHGHCTKVCPDPPCTNFAIL